MTEDIWGLLHTLLGPERIHHCDTVLGPGDLALRDRVSQCVRTIIESPIMDLNTVDSDGKYMEIIARSVGKDSGDIPRLTGCGGGGNQLKYICSKECNPVLSVRERNMFDIVNLVWSFRSVQQRMILRDTQLIRSSAGYRWNFITDGKIPKLKCLSRDAVMLSLAVNNTQERQVAPLVNRLEGYITPQVREQLLTSYTGIVCFSF